MGARFATETPIFSIYRNAPCFSFRWNLGRWKTAIMASLSTDIKTGLVRVVFYDRDKKRKTIYLGRVSNRTAQAVRDRVEAFLNAQLCNVQPSRNDCEWLMSSGFFEQFAKVGLAPQTDKPKAVQAPTLAEFLEQYQARRAGEVKPATRLVWSQVVGNLLEYMPKGIRLDEITTGHAKEFQSRLKAKGMKNSTIAKRLGFSRQFFNDAVDWEIIAKNPFSKVHTAKSSLKSNAFVSREVIDRVMRLSPIRWKVILALSRFGGLRTPSETLSIKWSQIDWERDRMLVPEPKVEHQEGRGLRTCPLFPELRKILEDAFEIYGGQSEYVVDMPTYRAAAQGKDGWQNANLRTQFLKLIAKAGLEPWPRLFHSMRASRQTELEESFPTHVVCSWIGNSVAIAKASYLLTTEEHFTRAAGKIALEEGQQDAYGLNPQAINPTRADSETSNFPSNAGDTQQARKPDRKSHKLCKNTAVLQLLLSFGVEDNGLEPMTSCMPCKRSPN